MRYFLACLNALLFTGILSCKKNSVTDCYPNDPVVRTVTNKNAVVKVTSNSVYIVEEGAIDSKLIPCNLPADVSVNDLRVIISGNVKSTIQGGPGVCCTEKFVIKTILRR